VTFALTDAPSDELASLNVELTRIAVLDSSGASTQVFPGAGGGRLQANLLQLRGVSKLLAHLSLPPGDYAQLQLDYTGATATDRAGNTLRVSPANGTVGASFTPALTVTGSNQLVEIDFDVDASVSNLVSGPGGSLTLDPTLLLDVQNQGTGYALEDFHATVTAVGPDFVDVQVQGGVIRVQVGSGATILSLGGVSTGLAGLAALAVGLEVEVHGSYDIAAGAVRAVAIELEDGAPGMRGPDTQGVVLSVGAADFELLVLERRDGVYPVGSVQRVSTDANTGFAYDGFPGLPATFANLTPGQEVRVFGAPSIASGVKLRATRVEGTVSAVGGGSATLDVTSFERVDVSGRPSLPAQIQVSLGGVSLSQGSRVELEGHFNRSAPGVFDPLTASQQGQEDDQIEGTTFQTVSSSPLTLTITGDAGQLGASVTLTVVTGPQTVVVERDRLGTTTVVTPADLEAGIGAGRYAELRAKGQVTGTTLSATSIRADLR